MLKPAMLSAVLIAALCGAANAENDGVLRIGVLNDMSSVYSDFQGPGSVTAAQLAVEDFAKQSKRKVEILSADHQNKPDIGAEIARRWFDVDGVDMIIDVPNSAVAFAVADIARDKNKVFIGSGAGSALLTGAKCSPNTVHWTYDTWAMGHGVARGLLQQGNKTWFFVSADYAFGADLQKQAADEVAAEGGQVLGNVRHPLGTSDFSSFLLQAQASGAQVIALANAGGDTVNAIKQAAEFNLSAKQKIVALIFDLQSVPALGLKAAEGITALNAFYWDLNDQTRAWSMRYQERHPKKEMPNRDHGLSRGGGQSGLPGRWPRRRRRDESNAGRRPAVRPCHHPAGRTRAASDVSAAGQDAGGIEGPMGRLQARSDHPGRSGFSSAERRRLCAGEQTELMRFRRRRESMEPICQLDRVPNDRFVALSRSRNPSGH
jgi:branched-chain amino acid transport system substrate-binding protein